MKNIILNLFLVLSFGACQSRPTVVRNDGLSETHRLDYASPPVWNSNMQDIKQHLVNLEPYIFDSTKFSAQEKRKYIAKEIHNMSAASKNVKHDPAIHSKDPTVKFVAEQFSEELQDADENFNAGRVEFTRWQMMQVTRYCMECHTRTREGSEIRSTVDNPPYIKTLSLLDQMEVMIAFRQFDPAFSLAIESLGKYKSTEKTTDKTNISVERMARMGLLVAVQFMQNREKAIQLVEVIDRNKELPSYMADSTRLWKKSIEKWDPNQRLDSLVALREVSKLEISDIESMRSVPALLRYMENTTSTDELAETLFLTGNSYDKLAKVSMLSLPEKYFELCITKAPQTTWAKKCYDRYEELTELGYSGSSGVHVPKKVRDHLGELKRLTQ